MIELNVQFQEKYKQLDSLCKDIFSSAEGVSVYIKEMESTNWQLRRYITDWDIIYKQLKHLRWIRNQLAHEVGAFNSDLATESDLKWLTDFYSSILKRTDPLAEAGKIEQKILSQRNISNTTQKQPPNTVKTSFWGRIKAKIKSWFS